MQQIFTYVFMTGYSPARMIRNVIFDAGGVLLEWNPPRVIAQLYPDPAIQAGIRQYIFEHPDWHEFDRGTITADSAPAHFAKLSGRTPDEVRELLRATAESLQPIPETIRLLERIAKERALTLLFTEHDMDVVFSIAQRVAVLHQGRLIAEGTPAEVQKHSEVRRVYLGERH